MRKIHFFIEYGKSTQCVCDKKNEHSERIAYFPDIYSNDISKVTCKNCKRTKIFKQFEKQEKDGWTKENIDKVAFKPKVENKFGQYLKVFIEIANEVQRAEIKHPDFPADLIHQSAVLNEESGEVTMAALDHIYAQKPISDVYTEAIHTAAVAVRMLLNRKDK